MSIAKGAGHTGAANATIFIAVIMVAAAIYFLQALLAPFLAALFLLVVISGLSRALRGVVPGLSRGWSMGIAVVVILAVSASIAWIAYDNITRLLSDADQYAARLNDAYARVQRLFGVSVPARVEALSRSVDIAQVVQGAANWLQAALSGTGFTILYLGFMMASGRSFSRKLLALTGARSGLEESMAIFERIREAVGSYIWVQTVTGVLIAVLSWMILWSLGVPSPIFWAFIIFVTSYVPIVGGVVGVIFPVLFSLAVSENLGTPLLLLVLLQLIQIVVGYVVQPRMQSHSMNIDAIVVLLSLALWSVLLGPVGAFLSTPLTVTAMVVLSQFPRTMWLAILLSADSRPVPAEVTQEAGKENN